MNQEKINFRQARDFGETFNVVVKFLRQNFKIYFQSLLFIAGPFVLITAIAGAFYQSSALSMFSVSSLGNGNPFANLMSRLGWPFVLFMLASIISGLAMIGTNYSFMLTYNEKGPGGFAVADVSAMFIKNIGNILSVFFVLFLIVLAFVIVFGGIMIGIGAAVPVLAAILIFLLFIAMMFFIPPLMWQLSAVYIVKMEGGRSVLESWSKTRQIMRDNFWWTWLIVVCGLIMVGLMSIVFALPQSIYNMVLMFGRLKGGEGETSITFLVVSTVCTFCSTLVYSLMYIINGFHYFSLAEKSDGKGLMERINEIGTTQSTNAEQQY